MSKIYQHQPHPHQPRNTNAMTQAEVDGGGINVRLAVWLTMHVGTMQCAWLFLAIGIGSLVGVITSNTLLALVCGSVSSYVLQLVLLSVLQVGSNTLARKQELMAEEQFRTTEKIYHQIGQIVRHLEAQDEELLKLSAPPPDAPATVSLPVEIAAAINAALDEHDKNTYRAARRPGKFKEVAPPAAPPPDEGEVAA